MIQPTQTAGSLIEQRQLELGITDDVLAEKVQYKPAVITMIKRGTMRLPLNKISAFASALQTDTVELLRVALGEGNAGLWEAIDPLLPLGQLADHEVNLLRHLRRISGGRKGAAVVLEGSSIIAVLVNP